MATNAFSETTISLPFAITAYGTVATANSQDKIWADRVTTVLGTAIGERALRYEFGSKIHESLWKNASEQQTLMDGVVADAFNDFLPLLTLRTVKVITNGTNPEISVEITYALPNEEQQVTLVGPFRMVTEVAVAGSVSISGNNPAIEGR
jgi:phage baseplate assembly protein W